MQINLWGKTALIGGSTQGLGKAIALQLAHSGASVTVMARNESKLKQVVSELPTRTGQQHQYLVVDFSDFAAFERTMKDFLARNPIDILVNNTQGPAAGTVLDKTPVDYQKAFELLFQTVCTTTLAALPHMQQQKWGRIINIASLSVREPIPSLALSNTIRSAVVSWAKTLSSAVAADNITVNNILTGLFETERIYQLAAFRAAAQGISVEAWMEQTRESNPVKRLGHPEEMGYLVCFLASDFASYITGTSIPIDGGNLKSV
jgi:3-oxoacyl-[acyl-carrier protein] reductase